MAKVEVIIEIGSKQIGIQVALHPGTLIFSRFSPKYLPAML
jgi:hypothetical protein